MATKNRPAEKDTRILKEGSTGSAGRSRTRNRTNPAASPRDGAGRENNERARGRYR